MPRTRESTAYAQRLIKEYNHARKLLHSYLKKRHDPNDVTDMITKVIQNMTNKQSKIIGYTLNKSFKAGTKEGDKILSKARVTAATATVGFDMSKVADTHLKKIPGATIGSIGKYNKELSKQLSLQYKMLLSDNKLVTTLAKSGWSPSIEKSLVKRGTSTEVISLLKGQTTTKKMVSLLETQGIRGGMHPHAVSRLLQPHVTNYFGPKGVIINKVGKFKKVLKVDVDGNYKYVKQAITRPYRATPKTYSNLLARSSMIQAHNEGRYQSLQKTGLVDFYISKSVLDANTCNLCATMHGQRVSHSEGPLYHPSCMCELKPIWKKDSGIANKDPSFYDKQRDQHFWKQHQLAEYNKNMPKGSKLKFHSMLPEDAIPTMPGKEAMHTIRYNALGKPAAITPTGPPKWGFSDDEFREKADVLWTNTEKDSKEHMMLFNGKFKEIRGTSNKVSFTPPKTSYISLHTHPEWDSPLSGPDIGNFLAVPQERVGGAITKESIYLIKKTSESERIYSQMGMRVLIKHLETEAAGFLKLIGPKKVTPRDLRTAYLKAGQELAREYHFEYKVISRK